jgi:mannose-6-phosphate isomerase-like protein (cupin superfamily)
MDSRKQRPIHVRAPAPPPEVIGPGGERYLALTTQAETRGLYFLAHVLVPPNGGPPMHVHHREDKGFFVHRGELTFRIGESVGPMRAGTFLMAPRGTAHAFRNEQPTDAELLIWFTPGEIEALFRELAGGAASNFEQRAKHYGVDHLTDDRPL